jgi:hypothetical protein
MAMGLDDLNHSARALIERPGIGEIEAEHVNHLADSVLAHFATFRNGLVELRLSVETSQRRMSGSM